jgi:glyoxylase-like metal-dependent hydrolase (beta-lactamase superfamily II)
MVRQNQGDRKPFTAGVEVPNMMMQTRACGAALSALLFSTYAVALDDSENDHHLRALVRARQKFFGIENVNAETGQVRSDRVIFSWVTNTTYAVSLQGRVFLLDSYVNRLEINPGRTPLVIQDLLDLRPAAILLGHGHGDHADNAAYLAKILEITIYSTPETCDVMQLDAARIFGKGNTVDCVGVVSRGSPPGAEVVTLDFLEPLACVTVFKHIHSGRVPTDPDFPFTPVDNIADPRDADMFPTGTPQWEVLDLRTTGFGGTAGPISLFYQFVMHEPPHFTFVWHNTTGPLKEQGPELFDLMDTLPKTDVELGSIVSLGYDTNGVRDAVLYNVHILPKVYIPGHQTDVALPSSSLEWKLSYLRTLDAMEIPRSQRPESRWMVDPNDYLRPLVYNPFNPRWRHRGGRPAGQCLGSSK